MKFLGSLAIFALLLVVSPTSFGNPVSLKPKKVIVEITVPGFGGPDRIEILVKKRRVISGGGAYGVSHSTTETLKAIKIWSYSYDVSLLKQEKGSDSMQLNFKISYEACGPQSINRMIEIKVGEVAEVEFQAGIKLRAYFEGVA